MNRQQLEQLVKSVHQEAYIWARQCCGFDEGMARDVLQQAYLKILEGKTEFSEKCKAKPGFSLSSATQLRNGIGKTADKCPGWMKWICQSPKLFIKQKTTRKRKQQLIQL
ncbi:RNA polymerase sigma factor [Litoribacter populi]|uniref:hypothetical protein n=1 Tax=Litoribacter populi TaxID=2598460 RepID=UPI00117FC834|nr:hypothetical protein [Litoribacter populi]